ncbi:helix-hairpin-helix domain-containing protein [Vogesella sp. LIG4]|uniref:helix-hairpin-helix domain-containing protein n=1 Tax=Vogesella sp. LIG4 TaxID=1192162 RepID=UPI000820191B|nr:helix-hairpin-helix domain-containing protein [Vogesella sp. LIG4]SCK22047.1 Helix-hairpin-helix motif-containing protein [Vogesella sp. LIG4]
MEFIMRKSLLVVALLGTSTAGVAAVLLDINTATVSQLEHAGFSPRSAQSIYNDTHPLSGPPTLFTSSKQLLGLPGITQGTLNRVRGRITIDGHPVTTRSGTAPAIPHVRRAIPAKKALPDDDNDSDHNGKGDHHSHEGKGGGKHG